jgi:hypothetical protein
LIEAQRYFVEIGLRITGPVVTAARHRHVKLGPKAGQPSLPKLLKENVAFKWD